MSSLTERGILREMTCGANLAYILAQNVSVQPTEYKVMQNPNVNCLVKCMRMKYNGQDELYYLTAGMKGFLNVFLSSSPDNAANLTAALLKSVVELKNVGFLSCTNIDAALNKAYVDFHTGRVRLIYLPIDQQFYSDEIMFENELRSALVQRIDELAGSSPKLTKMRQLLINATLSMQDIVNGGGGGGGVSEPPPPDPPPEKERKLILSAINAPAPLQLVVDSSEYRIGKNPDMDGVVTFNKFIGRTHCMILKNGSGFSVVDLNSKNGTFINQSRLSPQQPYGLKTGDVLRLANSDFQVTIQ